ncbi:MAG: hypothetical protein ACRD2B_10615 [Terriglobia bacterium]
MNLIIERQARTGVMLRTVVDVNLSLVNQVQTLAAARNGYAA